MERKRTYQIAAAVGIATALTYSLPLPRIEIQTGGIQRGYLNFDVALSPCRENDNATIIRDYTRFAVSLPHKPILEQIGMMYYDAKGSYCRGGLYIER